MKNPFRTLFFAWFYDLSTLTCFTFKLMDDGAASDSDKKKMVEAGYVLRGRCLPAVISKI